MGQAEYVLFVISWIIKILMLLLVVMVVVHLVTGSREVKGVVIGLALASFVALGCMTVIFLTVECRDQCVSH
jgi:hypothetical protein